MPCPDFVVDDTPSMASVLVDGPLGCLFPGVEGERLDDPCRRAPDQFFDDCIDGVGIVAACVKLNVIHEPVEVRFANGIGALPSLFAPIPCDKIKIGPDLDDTVRCGGH